jgi:hypothetical protein
MQETKETNVSQPPNKDNKNPIAQPKQAASIDKVRQIILTRKKNVLSGVIIVSLVLAGIILFNKSIDYKPTIIVGFMAMAPLIFIYSINARNYPEPKSSYRFWNKVIYKYFSKLIIISSFVAAISNVKNLLNPMRGYKDPSALSRPEELLDTAANVGIGVTAYAQLKPADYIEEYFKAREKSSDSF